MSQTSHAPYGRKRSCKHSKTYNQGKEDIEKKRTEKYLKEKIQNDFGFNLIGSLAYTHNAVKDLQDIVAQAKLRSGRYKDIRVDSIESWPDITNKYNEENYIADLQTVHKASEGWLIMSASSVSVGACACILSMKEDFKKYCGTDFDADVYGRNGREHIDRAIANPNTDFIISLSDCFFQMDSNRNFDYQMLNVITCSRQRLYYKKSTRVIKKPVVFVSEFSTGKMQATIKLGVPSNATIKQFPTSDHLVAFADEMEWGNYIIAWDPLWHKFDLNECFEKVPGSDYDCYHALFCHNRWKQQNRNYAREAFLRIFIYNWNRLFLSQNLAFNILKNDELYMLSFAQSCGKRWLIGTPNSWLIHSPT